MSPGNLFLKKDARPVYCLWPVLSAYTDFIRKFELPIYQGERNLFYTSSTKYKSCSSKGVNRENIPTD